MRWLDKCWAKVYTCNMTNIEVHPCDDCPGTAHGCHFDETNMVCVPHTATKMHQIIDTPISLHERVQKILRHCEGLTASGAYNVIELFSGPNEIVWPLSGEQKREIILKRFVLGDDVNWCMAANVRFKFWGGPPDRLTYYNGTLETLLKDRVLDYLNNYGISETERMLQIKEEKEIQKCLFS